MDSNGAGYDRGPAANGAAVNTPPLSPRGPRNPSGNMAVPEPLRPSATALSRAEKYEDEKRRISASCFNKVDDQGRPMQSYITHIRVEEDAVYQSSPPPPNHPSHHKKPRIIVVAVKNNGRVTMHKARENEDSTFQIGKSWPLEELQSIESFSSSVPRIPEEEIRAKWAGPTGFIIVMAKPYYWQAKTAKEKDFFIGSLVKIYNKYTEGKVPTLVGFEQRDKDQILGGTRPPQSFQSSPRQQSTAPLQVTPQSPLQPPVRPPPPDARSSSASSAADARSASATPVEPLRPAVAGPRQFPQRGPSPAQTPPPGQLPNVRPRGPTPQSSQRPSEDRVPRQISNQEQPRPPFAQGSSPAPSPNLIPQGSRGVVAENLASGTTPPVISPMRQVERSRSGQDQPLGPPPALRSPEPRGPAIVPAPERRRPFNEPIKPTPDQFQTPLRSPSGVRDATDTSSIVSRTSASSGPSTNDISQALPERRRPPLKETVRESVKEPVKEPIREPIKEPVKEPTLPIISKPLLSSSGRSSPRPLGPVGTPSGGLVSNERSATPPVSLTPATPATPASDSPAITPSPQVPPPTEPAVPLTDVNTDKTASSLSREIVTDQNGVSAEPAQSDEPSPTPPPVDQEQYRPGLGPMLSKKAEVASKMRKAVTAHTAFKPRAGGAAERLLGVKAKATDEPDGITGVVPSRSATTRVASQDSAKPSTEERKSSEKSRELPAAEVPPPDAPIVQAPRPKSIERPLSRTIAQQTSDIAPETVSEPVKDPPPQRPSRPQSKQLKRRRSNPFDSALSAMDVDPEILDGRQLDYEEILGEFGWDRNFLQTKKLDALEADLRREVGRLEAGSWLGHSDQKDERVGVVEKLLDKAIAECDEMEGLLTLYSVELSTLNDDITYIEAQSQGLQVQTANQKLLQTELQNLVRTISLDTGQMEPLRAASLGDLKGLESIESSLLLLYKALQTMDPKSVNSESTANPRNSIATTMTSMRALQERKESYLGETSTFLHRLRHYVDPTFGAALHKTKDAFARNNAANQYSTAAHDLARAELWRYSPLMLFAKEVNKEAWDDMLRAYQGRARELYQEEVRDCVAEWKRRVRKASGEEHDALFTAQEKESEGLASTARKLTVKRSQTLARGLRQASAEKKYGISQNRDGNQLPSEVFAGALGEMLPIIITEQNFVVDFFHATSLEDFSFPDAVKFEPLSSRQGTDLSTKRPPEPDRAVAKRVMQAMEIIFNSWANEMQSLMEWAIKQDQFQGVGILFAVERALQDCADSSQEFVIRTLTSLHDKLAGLFSRFVDDQVRSIEATKVKIKKRKGVMAFIKVFPNFSAVVENMVPPVSDGEKLEIRANVDNAYERINKAMFSSLKQIAKDTPTALNTIHVNGAQSGSSNADPEDKEALNHEILLIENMFHYYTEVDERSSPVLGAWRGKAMLEMSEHQDRYVNAVIRRPLGRLLDFLEGVEAQGVSAVKAAEQSIYSRAAFKKLLTTYYDAKEFRRGIDALRKRIEKHFGESSEDLALNQKLVAQILAECERKYNSVVERTELARTDIYGGDVDVEFSRSDVTQGFRR